jgi:hypothetical protein
MKSKLVLLFGISVVMIIITGCPYESNLTLSDPKDSSIDPDITGKWLVNMSSPGSQDTLIVMRFNDHEYYFESHEIKNSKLIIDRGRGFITRINDVKLLNLCGLDEPSKFYFAKYVCSGNKMVLTYSSDQFIKTQFGSSRELFDFFKTHIDEQGFFEPGDTLIRVKEY